MLRQIHSLPGLAFALVVMVLAMSGAILSLEPALDRAAAPAIEPGRISVAALAEAAKARHGEIDKIVRTASGSIIVSYFDGDRAGAERVDPATGAALGAHAPSGFMRWITNLHRAFLAGDAGRAVAGCGALAMLVLSISGAMMLAARLGGWRAFFSPVRGTPVQRWHTVTGRIVLPALLLSALTGCYLSLATFELIPDASVNPPALTATANGGPRVPVGDLAALKAVDLADLRELAFPYAGDLTDTYALTTARGVSAIDPATGAELGFAPHGLALEAANLKYSDGQVSETSDNIRSAEIFQSPDVDAAVVWAPYDEVLKAVPGSKVLLTTKDQSHIIGDIMFAKDDYIKKNPDKIRAFYEGWMKATAEIQAEQSNKMKAAKLLGEFLNVSTDDAAGAMSLVYNANHGDNLNFFGLNNEYLGQKGGDIYDKMNKEFVKMKTLEAAAPYWRAVINTSAIQSASANLNGPGQAAEKSKAFTPPTEANKSIEAVASKPISINFNTGEFTLSENAKTIIDLQFSDIAKTFANARIRVEGNTDNVGSRSSNMTLSQKRAQSVDDYLQKTYGMDINRFIIVGNGPDKPVPGCETNATKECKAKNRRTEFQLIPI